MVIICTLLLLLISRLSVNPLNFISHRADSDCLETVSSSLQTTPRQFAVMCYYNLKAL